MIENLLITSIKGYSIAELIFTVSMIMILTTFISYFLLNMIRFLFTFNYKAQPHFVSINRMLGKVIIIFVSFLIVAILMYYFH